MRLWWEKISVRKQGSALIIMGLAGMMLLTLLLFVLVPLLNLQVPAFHGLSGRLIAFLIHLPVIPITISFVVGLIILISGKPWNTLKLWLRIPILVIGVLTSFAVIYVNFALSNKIINSFVYADQTLEDSDFADPYLMLEELIVKADKCPEGDLACLASVEEDFTIYVGHMRDVLEVYPKLRTKGVVYIEGLGKKRILRYQDFESMSNRYREKLERAKKKG